ncbi:interferon gamma receptor 2 [Anomaloglossus baeobatrachus]|uniref:interferon gamma receptor 2 n=1 Tax=Anomaloglossus baeobatrachus TaxID=238106 RepID=UPI003F509F7B
MWPLLLTLSTLAPAPHNTSEDLLAPSNVHIDSYNLQHTVRWDAAPVEDPQLPLMYRVECVLFNEIRVVCENITETHCDFTDEVEPFWRGKYRVRAEVGEWRSAWAEAPGEFQASIHTKIGPVRSLVVESHANAVTIRFLPPVSPVPDNFILKYRLYYWKEDSEDTMELPLTVSTHFGLKDLEELTVYCVQVEASTNLIEGEKSDPKCAKTLRREYTGQELAVIVTCITLVCMICSIVGYVIYRYNALLKHFLYPPFRLPNHIQEFLECPPEQSDEAAFCASHNEEHHIDIIEITYLTEDNQMSDEPSLVHAEKT